MANNEESDLIEVAVSEAIKSMDDHRDGDILVEWVVLGYVTNPDREEGDAHPVLVSNGLIPTHHAIGLLRKALFKLEWGGWDQD